MSGSFFSAQDTKFCKYTKLNGYKQKEKKRKKGLDKNHVKTK